MTLIYLGLQEVILIDLLVYRCKLPIYKRILLVAQRKSDIKTLLHQYVISSLEFRVLINKIAKALFLGLLQSKKNK